MAMGTYIPAKKIYGTKRIVLSQGFSNKGQVVIGYIFTWKISQAVMNKLNKTHNAIKLFIELRAFISKQVYLT